MGLYHNTTNHNQRRGRYIVDESRNKIGDRLKFYGATSQKKNSEVEELSEATILNHANGCLMNYIERHSSNHRIHGTMSQWNKSQKHLRKLAKEKPIIYQEVQFILDDDRPLCKLEGCESKAKFLCFGLCRGHYQDLVMSYVYNSDNEKDLFAGIECRG